MISLDKNWGLDIIKMKTNQTYEFLLEEYTVEEIQQRALYWYRVAEETIKSAGLSDEVIIDSVALRDMVLCYFCDIVRLKNFHNIKNINDSKIYAYGSFWFLRLHPVCTTKKQPSAASSCINEKIVLHIITCEFLECKKDEDECKKYISHLYYFLHYRNYTARTLELVIDSLQLN